MAGMGSARLTVMLMPGPAYCVELLQLLGREAGLVTQRPQRGLWPLAARVLGRQANHCLVDVVLQRCQGWGEAAAGRPRCHMRGGGGRSGGRAGSADWGLIMGSCMAYIHTCIYAFRILHSLCAHGSRTQFVDIFQAYRPISKLSRGQVAKPQLHDCMRSLLCMR